MHDVDFLPEKIKLQRVRRRRFVRQGYMLAVCVVAMGFLGYLRAGRISTARGELSLLDQRVANVRRQLDLRADLERQQADLFVKKRISDQFGSRVEVLDLLAELERVLPKDVTLTSLNVETLEVDIPVIPVKIRSVCAVTNNNNQSKSRRVRRVRLELTGLAPNDVTVANFIGQLSASLLFEDVSMAYAKNVVFQKHIAREFRASCFVVK